jgi:hypothetical protein
MVSICPESKLLNDYRENVEGKLTTEEMTADQSWVYCHIKECDDCKNLVNS